MFLYSEAERRIPCSDPGKIALEDRLIAFGRRERKIAYFCESPNTSTFRYRVFNMVEALNSSIELGVSASWFSHADLDRTTRFINEADALVVCRSRYNAELGRLIARARARRIPVLFDVDDLVFDPDYIHLILDALDEDAESEQAWNWWAAYTTRLAMTLRLCDGAITTNQYLADRIDSFAPGIRSRIVPNFLNRNQQEESARIWLCKERSGFARNSTIDIAYFSGTPTHNRDFSIVAPALARLMEEDSRIAVRIVGYPGSKPSMLKHPQRLRVLPLQDFINLPQSIGEVEISIAPVQANAFSNCKSELKYFESAIVGAVTVASPTFSFKRAIKDGENGFLAAAHEWAIKLRAAIAAAERRETYLPLAALARQHCVESYGWNAHAHNIEAVVFGGSGGLPITRPAYAGGECAKS